MSISNDLIDKIKHLPAHQQVLVSNLVDELATVDEKKKPNQSADWLGCLAHLKVDITESDLAAARQEM